MADIPPPITGVNGPNMTFVDNVGGVGTGETGVMGLDGAGGPGIERGVKMKLKFEIRSLAQGERWNRGTPASASWANREGTRMGMGGEKRKADGEAMVSIENTYRPQELGDGKLGQTAVGATGFSGQTYTAIKKGGGVKGSTLKAGANINLGGITELPGPPEIEEGSITHRMRSKRRRLMCSDARFVPGKFTIDLMKEEELQLPPSFALSLFPEGFSLDEVSSSRTEPVGPQYPYDRTMHPLLSAINGGRMPGTILGGLPCIYKDGCICVELRDYRHTSSRVSNAATKVPQQPSPFTNLVLLRQSTESRVTDIEMASGGEWSESVRLAVESLLLQATKPEVCLDPNPKVAELFALNHIQSNSLLVGAPLRRIVALPPVQSFKLPQGMMDKLYSQSRHMSLDQAHRGGKGLVQSHPSGNDGSGSMARIHPTGPHKMTGMVAAAAPKGKVGRTDPNLGGVDALGRQMLLQQAMAKPGGTEKAERYSPQSRSAILSLKDLVMESRTVPQLTPAKNPGRIMQTVAPTSFPVPDNLYRELRVVVKPKTADHQQGNNNKPSLPDPSSLSMSSYRGTAAAAQGVSGGVAKDSLSSESEHTGRTRPCRTCFIGWMAEGDANGTWMKPLDPRGSLRVEVLGNAQDSPLWMDSEYAWADVMWGSKMAGIDMMHSTEFVLLPRLTSSEGMERIAHEYVRQLAREGRLSVEASSLVRKSDEAFIRGSSGRLGVLEQSLHNGITRTASGMTKQKLTMEARQHIGNQMQYTQQQAMLNGRMSPNGISVPMAGKQ